MGLRDCCDNGYSRYSKSSFGGGIASSDTVCISYAGLDRHRMSRPIGKSLAVGLFKSLSTLHYPVTPYVHCVMNSSLCRIIHKDISLISYRCLAAISRHI
ncbi:Hypothetical predicted protein [Octopus vulgaris]|uniref:Uncharacterized protein n=1 Tax=Octopus vulgaris TaxID=6645 RepID=A0AA36B815_OCTVU|nr:Hypothetical predicted protein [Octopus vulgaris]